MAQTAMAEAFARAGVHPLEAPDARLKRMMRTAIVAGNGKLDPSRDYFIAALSGANDPALLWELFALVRASVIGRLFTETLIEMRGEIALKNAGGADFSMPQGQSGIASPATLTEGAATSELPKGHVIPAASSATNAAAGGIRGVPEGQKIPSPAAAPPQKPSRLRYESVEKVARLSILRTFKINGQPLAEVTGAEARAWLKNHQRDGRFVALITYQVPDEIKVGAIVPDDEADRMFKLASDAGNA